VLSGQEPSRQAAEAMVARAARRMLRTLAGEVNTPSRDLPA
jgi:hypothetical protein